MVASALRLAAMGWSIFPCRPDKSPLTAHGFKDASRDHERIIAWWKRFPAANVAIATGEPSGIFVIDLDVDPTKNIDGITTIKSIGSLPQETIIARSPRGGLHVYFQHHPDVRCSRGSLPPGVDVKGVGGCITVPPSRRGDGAPYRWVHPPTEHKPASAPDWLLRAINPPRPVIERKPIRVSSCPSNYVRAALFEEYDVVAGAQQGTRNHQLNRSAFSLGTLVGAGLLDEEDVTAHLTEAALVAGLDRREIAITIRSGLRAGIAKPRRTA